MSMRLGAISSVLALALLPLAGCDLLTTKVSKDKLEAELATWLEDHNLEATEITCPDNQKMEKGNRFECHCKVQGIDVPVRVEVTDASSGKVEWEPKYQTVPREKMEAGLLALPELAGRTLEIECETVLVSVPDSDWACDAVDKAAGDLAMVLTVHFTDGEGTYDWKLEPKGS
ncbi:DUF4333 domain-containing protein [Enhygromyxa salina]|nr:DUF4333 domain-containing protein [Enhygromyxa salina]